MSDPTEPTPPAEPAVEPAPVPEPPKPAPPAEPKPPAQESKKFDADYVEKLRKEAAEHRVKAKEAEEGRTAAEQREKDRADAIAKALGLKDDDAPPDPAELAKQLEAERTTAAQARAEAQTLRVERAAEKAARTHGGDVDALLDSRNFTDALAKIDPAAEDFTQQLDALVKTTVDTNPRYQVAGQAPTTTSGDFSGGSGDKAGPSTVDDFRALRNKHREV